MIFRCGPARLRRTFWLPQQYSRRHRHHRRGLTLIPCSLPGHDPGVCRVPYVLTVSRPGAKVSRVSDLGGYFRSRPQRTVFRGVETYILHFLTFNHISTAPHVTRVTSRQGPVNGRFSGVKDSYDAPIALGSWRRVTPVAFIMRVTR
jgi:hypothetical protein